MMIMRYFGMKVGVEWIILAGSNWCCGIVIQWIGFPQNILTYLNQKL